MNGSSRFTHPLVDAFVAFGGTRDKSGSIDNQRLIKTVRDDFGLTVKIERLLEELDKDRDGKISYSEFASLFA